jgi:PAS domain S-box-containing protein
VGKKVRKFWVAVTSAVFMLWSLLVGYVGFRFYHITNLTFYTALVWAAGVAMLICGIVAGKNSKRPDVPGGKFDSLLDAVFNSVDDGISVLDKDLNIVYVNPIMEKWYAQNLPLIGKKCYFAYHNKQKPCDPCPSLRAIQTGKRESETVEGLPGSPAKWLDVYSFPVKDQRTGEIIGVSEFVRDITDIVQKEEALRETQAQLDALFQNMMEGVAFHEIVRDENGIPINYRILKVNPQYERIVGIPAEKAVGKLATEVYGTEKLPLFMEYVGVVMSRKPLVLETYVDEVKKYFHISVVPWGDNGFFTVFTDLTDRKQMELQIQRGQKLEAIGLLAGGIAHDLNNILQIISGYTEIALQRISSDHNLWEPLNYVQDAGKRAADLVRQILTFSRRYPSHPAIINVNENISNLLKMIKRLIGEHIVVEFYPAEDIGFIKIDPAMFDQLIINLCVNARDAMPKGGELVIRTKNVVVDEDYIQNHPWALPGDYVCILISDSGEGIPPEIIDKIFDPFFTTKEHGKGTGLGLATVYGIVKQHNGMIHVYSELGKGTTFKVYFPFIHSDARNHLSDTSNARNFKGKETVLLAEDDDEVRRFVRSVLEDAGYKVIEARDGVEAWDLAVKMRKSVDLLVMDVVMPRLGGIEVVDKLKSMNLIKPVVFISGYSEDAFPVKELPKDQHVAYVSKPFSREEFLLTVRELIDQYKHK